VNLLSAGMRGDPRKRQLGPHTRVVFTQIAAQ
jgi:hypothetical protein